MAEDYLVEASDTHAGAGVTFEAISSFSDGEVGSRGRKLGIGGWFAVGWMTLLIALCILAPVLPFIPKYDTIYPEIADVGPFQSSAHILGGDGNGHDMVSILVYGARASLLVGVGAVLFGLLIGGLLGLLAGYHKGKTDAVLSSGFNILLAFPQLVLALFLVAVLRGDPDHPEGFHLPTEAILILSLGIVAIPLLARITRASTLAWSQRDFVVAAKAQGSTTSRIIFREVLPNVMPAMLSLALLAVGIAIVAEGALSLLGVGIQLPTPSWGNTIALGYPSLRESPYIVLLPCLALFFTVFSLNYLGDIIRERFDVRESAL